MEMRYIFCLIFIIIFNYTNAKLINDVNEQKKITSFAFGSCNKQYKSQPLWDIIAEKKPEFFIWLGDATYLDTFYILPWYRYPSDLKTMKEQWDVQKSKPEYKKFRDQVPIIGVWDDHDFGLNDGGSWYKERASSQQLYLDFLDEPKNSKRRQQAGVYTSYVFGPIGERIKIILLDIRYHQTNNDGIDGDLLGEQQWKWLENELNNNEAQITFIGSGIQIVSYNKIAGEGWKNFPTSRQRLYNLMNKANRERDNPTAYIMLSGDVHYAEIAKTHICSHDRKAIYPIYDITSSGMTHAWAHYPLPQFLLNFLFNKFATHSCIVDQQYFLDFNYGFVEINWEKRMIKCTVNGVDGQQLNLTRSFSHFTSLSSSLSKDEDTLKDCDYTDSLMYGQNNINISGIEFLHQLTVFVATCIILFIGLVIYYYSKKTKKTQKSKLK